MEPTQSRGTRADATSFWSGCKVEVVQRSSPADGRGRRPPVGRSQTAAGTEIASINSAGTSAAGGLLGKGKKRLVSSLDRLSIIVQVATHQGHSPCFSNSSLLIGGRLPRVYSYRTRNSAAVHTLPPWEVRVEEWTQRLAGRVAGPLTTPGLGPAPERFPSGPIRRCRGGAERFVTFPVGRCTMHDVAHLLFLAVRFRGDFPGPRINLCSLRLSAAAGLDKLCPVALMLRSRP